MRKLILLLLPVLLFPLTTLSAKDGKAAIEFEKTTHDFGNIAEDGGPVTVEFTFTNTGDAPLVILSASASCGCTKPKYPVRPVKPGDKESIKVTYLPADRPGEFVKDVTVRTNAPKGKKVKLRISGNVIPSK